MQANPNDVPISKEISSESEHGKASQVAYRLLALCTFFFVYILSTPLEIYQSKSDSQGFT